MNALSEVMTITEISSIFGVTPEAIKKHVRELFPEILQNGRITFLNEYQITEIKKRMTPTTKVVGSKTDIEMQEKAIEVMQWMSDKIKALQSENSSLKPKAIGYEMFLSGKNYMTISEAAKLLNTGRNRLFNILKERKILMSNTLPYQRFIDEKYCVVKENAIKMGDASFNKPQTYLTPKGFDYIQKLLIG